MDFKDILWTGGLALIALLILVGIGVGLTFCCLHFGVWETCITIAVIVSLRYTRTVSGDLSSLQSSFYNFRDRYWEGVWKKEEAARQRLEREAND